MKIGFIGIGHVGFSIADRLQKPGHEIIVGSNDSNSESLKKALKENPSFKTAEVREKHLTFMALRILPTTRSQNTMLNRIFYFLTINYN